MQDTIPAVCLDIGGTLTKLVFASKLELPEYTNNLTIQNGYKGHNIYFLSIPNNIEELINRLKSIGLLGQPMLITGGGAFKFKEKLEVYGNIVKVNEFESLCNGLRLLDSTQSNSFFTFDKEPQYLQLTKTIYPFLMVQIGSGVSILKFNTPTEYTRVAGTSLGGGMFLGLCHLFTGINNFDQLLAMTKRGSNATTDLLMNEVHIGASSPGYPINQGETSVAVSLGKLQQKYPKKEEDLVKSLLYMTAYNISQIAFMVSKLHNIERVFFSGHFIRNHTETLECISEAFQYFSLQDGIQRYVFINQNQPYFIKHDGFIGALGTLQGVILE